MRLHCMHFLTLQPPPVYTETSESPLIDLGEEITTPQIDQLERDIASLGNDLMWIRVLVGLCVPVSTSVTCMY